MTKIFTKSIFHPWYPYHYKKKSFISDKIFRRATDGTRMEHGFPKETFQGKLRVANDNALVLNLDKPRRPPRCSSP